MRRNWASTGRNRSNFDPIVAKFSRRDSFSTVAHRVDLFRDAKSRRVKYFAKIVANGRKEKKKKNNAYEKCEQLQNGAPTARRLFLASRFNLQRRARYPSRFNLRRRVDPSSIALPIIPNIPRYTYLRHFHGAPPTREIRRANRSSFLINLAPREDITHAIGRRNGRYFSPLGLQVAELRRDTRKGAKGSRRRDVLTAGSRPDRISIR